MSCYLYRGFGTDIYQDVAACLTPKVCGEFKHVFNHDGSITYDGSATYGASSQNAVLRHQLNQAGLPTSGISTSPHKDRAVFYALGGGRRKEGIVITIDRSSLVKHGVIEHAVSDTVVKPSVPEDDEVILVSIYGGPLSLAIVVSMEKVYA